jgi:hypothetical protein
VQAGLFTVKLVPWLVPGGADAVPDSVAEATGD